MRLVSVSISWLYFCTYHSNNPNEQNLEVRNSTFSYLFLKYNLPSSYAVGYVTEFLLVLGRHDSLFVKEIISLISCRRQDAHMSLHLQPTIDSGKDYLNHLLSVVSDDILIIGIYGISNIGKTNIAKAVYNQNFLKFDGSSYLATVDAVSKQPNGLIKLQEQLLSDVLLDDDDIQIDDVSTGVKEIKKRLQSKRVLVVLDDVAELDQLNALARRRDWFGFGSRIIITTRDANLLSVLESDDAYGPQGIQV